MFVTIAVVFTLKFCFALILDLRFAFRAFAGLLLKIVEYFKQKMLAYKTLL